jgi:exodeoxyribonuclease V alpha subunit
VERITFHSEETGFCVLRVKVRGQRQLQTVVGCLPDVVVGEWLRAEGQWTMNREHGRQFKAETLETLPPDSIDGITRFLGSGLIKGIGPVYAGKLVERFGKDIFDIIENRSAVLEKVEGIGPKRRKLIKESWNETRAVRSIMAFLLSHGVSTNRAFRIFKTYGDNAIKQVRDDPYCLARDIRGIGFKSADKIAQSVGIAKDSDLRARAGVEYVLQEITGEGHCAYPRRGLIDKAEEILEVDETIISRAIDHGIETSRLKTGMWQQEPIIYLATLYHCEKLLAQMLNELASRKHPCPEFDVEKAIEWSENKIGLELAAAQREAIRVMVRSKVSVVTGGPGVGKTTLINSLLRILLAKRMRVVLCAPTGRAAKRMAETTGCEASTIHRLLAFDPRQGRFRHDENHPLEGDVFVVDETSMIDLPLACSLVRAIPKRAALVLVGDIDQLPSVGPGMVLRDIIESDRFPVCHLTHVFRQAEGSDIIRSAHQINHGQMPYFGEKNSNSDFFFAEADEPEQAEDLILRMVSERIPQRFGFDPIRDIQVLTPMRRGILGSQNLNARLQEVLNPAQSRIGMFGVLYHAGDKVMQLENNYDKEVFNGDMGHVVSIQHETRELTVDFDGRKVVYDFLELDELVPSYAITIHKSQGSEYPCVVIPVHTQHYIMLQRNLLYTAVTRGKKLVVLVGSKKAVSLSVRRKDAHVRITTLQERLGAVL